MSWQPIARCWAKAMLHRAARLLAGGKARPIPAPGYQCLRGSSLKNRKSMPRSRRNRPDVSRVHVPISSPGWLSAITSIPRPHRIGVIAVVMKLSSCPRSAACFDRSPSGIRHIPHRRPEQTAPPGLSFRNSGPPPSAAFRFNAAQITASPSPLSTPVSMRPVRRIAPAHTADRRPNARPIGYAR